MNLRAIFPILLAVLIALVGSFLTYRWVKLQVRPTEEPTEQAAELVSIAVAAVDLPWGKKLAGELKSPFGAVTNWSAVRVESAEAKPENPVRLRPAPAEDAPASPAVAAKPKPAPFPTELDADRQLRPSKTGANLRNANGTGLTATGKT